MRLKHCHRLLVPVALAFSLLVGLTGASGETTTTLAPSVQPIGPGDTVIVSMATLAWLVHAPADGSVPVVVAVFHFGGDTPPPPPPPPGKVAGIFIVEEQADRTAAQARVMDDPVWQAAAVKKGMTWKIEDDDHPSVAKLVGAIKPQRPVVVYVDADGKPVAVVPLPDSVEQMRELIGGIK